MTMITTYETVGETTELEFVTDQAGFDTEVRIYTSTLCWISKEDKSNFTKELQELITKYAI